MVHPDPDMKEPHVDPNDAFVIAAEGVCIFDQLEIQPVLFLFVVM